MRIRAKLDRLTEVAAWCKRAGRTDKQLRRAPEREGLTGWGVLRRIIPEHLQLLHPYERVWALEVHHAQERYLRARDGAPEAVADCLAELHQRRARAPHPPVLEQWLEQEGF